MQVTQISAHGRTRNGKPYANNKQGRTTRLGWGMFTVVVGKGSKKRSITVHGTHQMAESAGARYE